LKTLDPTRAYVTPEKLQEAVRRIVETADPLQIILFGSRARGDYRESSDLDLAVILDTSEEEAQQRLPYSTLRGIRAEIDMIVVSKKRYDEFRPWINSVFRYIDEEGVVLYDRDHPERADEEALRCGAARRRDLAASAA
jgi:uncharacterized protein